LRGLSGISNPPNRAAAVLGNEQGAILVHCHADRPPPDFGIVDNEGGNEIVVFAGRDSVLDDDADDLIAGALGAIP